MNNILVLKTSVNGEKSFSNKVVDAIVAKAKATSPDVTITERDLNQHGVPVLTAETAAAIRAGLSESAVQQQAIALADTLISELKNADHIIIGLPRYNFTAPASFKAYVDYIARPRVTFRYGVNGPEGLLPDVGVTVVIASGGSYAGQPYDFMTGWVKQVLGFVGLVNVNVIHVENTAMAGEQALAQAYEAVDKLF
ncbi:NAD(P)H-dependent oxidoreductase [Pasteurellaceae bacterium 20609_3]|uniref:FMN-dependent NADH-azoreductase n=1 Tax=Spirabiliibacterium mucosae TaxID=28156 RepID=UPI001AADD0B6|nr:NAD(P)H-dependent oxidoreductase [Spirabiliibacterium mucosae]MBE2898275.1 NAD(P)H-dependent oxidoreductase [Spirabiliibacterium mucosae]